MKFSCATVGIFPSYPAGKGKGLAIASPEVSSLFLLAPVRAGLCLGVVFNRIPEDLLEM